MKKMILGVGIFICGLIIFCTDYITYHVIDAMPDTTIVDGVAVFSLTTISIVVMLVGVILTVMGYTEK